MIFIVVVVFDDDDVVVVDDVNDLKVEHLVVGSHLVFRPRKAVSFKTARQTLNNSMLCVPF